MNAAQTRAIALAILEADSTLREKSNVATVERLLPEALTAFRIVCLSGQKCPTPGPVCIGPHLEETPALL